jgi:hypothetical protein
MKKILLAGVLCWLFQAVSFGQTVSTPSSYIQNDTGFTLYLKTVSASEYRQVPPGGLLPSGVDEDLEGFLYERSTFQMPTVEIPATVLTEGGFLRVTRDYLSNARTVNPSDVAAIISGPTLDNRYLDWLSIPALFARGRGRQPLGSFLDVGSGRQSVPTGDSLLWERAGTDLEWMKTSRRGEDLYIAASTYSVFARTSSLNLYIYGSGDLPIASIDIDAASDSALILMWMPLAPEPVVVGNSVASDFFVEAQIWLDVLASAFPDGTDVGEVLAGNLLAQETLAGETRTGSDPLAGLSVEIATATSAAGTWEEFVLARVALSEVLGL